MSTRKVYNIDEVTDAITVAGIVVIAEYAKLLAHANGGLSQIRDEILGNSVRQFADFGARMSSNRIEVTKYDALERRSGVDYISYNLLRNLLCVAVRRSGLLDGERLRSRD